MRREWIVELCLVCVAIGTTIETSSKALDPQIFPSLLEADLHQLQTGLIAKHFTSVDLVNAYLNRVEEVNHALHAVNDKNPDALNIAAELDAMRAAGRVLGPLHGIPVCLKDNIATYDMNNTAGSFALVGAKVPTDSTVAAKLRNAGAILLHKSNLSQWAFFRSFNLSGGWSAYGGQTFAAYYPEQNPSGSSSGSGVVSSIGLAWACLGTETDGSIVSPSEVQNIVGIKPTVGLTSRHLVVPISEHQDTVGPMARTVLDAAYLLQTVAGVDPMDNYTSSIPHGGAIPNYVTACNASALKGARLGVPYNIVEWMGQDDRTKPIAEAFAETLTLLKDKEAFIVESNFTVLENLTESTADEWTVLEVDFKSNLETYLSQLVSIPTGVRNLEDLRNFTLHFPAEEFTSGSRDVSFWDSSLSLFNQSSAEFWETYQRALIRGGRGGLLGALERHRLDAVLLPTQVAHYYAATIGAPIVTVPMGFYPPDTNVTRSRHGHVETAPGVPFGLSFLGERFSEAKLIGLAYAYEQYTNVRSKGRPYITPKTELADIVTQRLHGTPRVSDGEMNMEQQVL